MDLPSVLQGFMKKTFNTGDMVCIDQATDVLASALLGTECIALLDDWQIDILKSGGSIHLPKKETSPSLYKASIAIVLSSASFMKEIKNKRIPSYEMSFSQILTFEGIGWCNNSWLRLVE